MTITGSDITLTGGWAILTFVIWIAVLSIGAGGILLIAYWVVDYTLRRTLQTFKILDAFRQFIIETHRTKPG